MTLRVPISSQPSKRTRDALSTPGNAFKSGLDDTISEALIPIDDITMTARRRPLSSAVVDPRVATSFS